MPYLTAAGQIRVLEKKLLDATNVERMVDAPNAESAFKVFSDTDLADNLLNVEASDYKKALDDDLRQTKNFLEKITGDKNLLKLIFVRYDFHNIKLFLKMRFFGDDLSADLSETGMIDVWDLKKYIIDENKKIDLPKDIIEIIKKIRSNLDDLTKKAADSSEIDLLADKEYYALSQKLAKNIGNNFISDFVRRQIDIANIKSLLRIKKLGRDEIFLKKTLIDGGKIDTQKLSGFLKKDIEDLIKFLRNYLTPSEEKFLEEYGKKKHLWQLEKGFENLEMAYIKKTKWMSCGPELILAYYYAKKNAIRNIRLIMTGKLNNIASEEIKERVRMTF